MTSAGEVQQPDPGYPRYQRGDLRQVFVVGARVMLRERGEDRFSLNELARRIGVSPGSAYRHFANKEALLAAVRAQAYRQLGLDLLLPFPISPGPGERVIGLGIRYVEFAVANADVFFMMFANRPVDSETGGTDSFTPLLDAVLEAQRSHHLAAGDARTTAGAIWVTLHGLAVLHVNGGLDALGLDASPEDLVRRTLTLQFPSLSA